MVIPTPTVPLHLSLSSDSLTLCVAWRANNILSLNFFDTRAVVLKVSLHTMSRIVGNYIFLYLSRALLCNHSAVLPLPQNQVPCVCALTRTYSGLPISQVWV